MNLFENIIGRFRYCLLENHRLQVSEYIRDYPWVKLRCDYCGWEYVSVKTVDIARGKVALIHQRKHNIQEKKVLIEKCKSYKTSLFTTSV